MTGTGNQLLREQLKQASLELAQGGGEPLEVAILAGLLQRMAPDDEVLTSLDVAVPPQQLLQAIHEALDLVLEIEEDDDAAESWDALAALDETCAAAHWLGHSPLAEGAIDDATSLVRAFPEAWRVHSERATEVLRSRTPRSGDPAGRLWAVVEGTPWVTDEPSSTADAVPLDLKFRLGMEVVVPLAPFLAHGERLAAAQGLPEPAPWRRLGRGDDWELALTVGDDDQPILVLSGGSEAEFEHEGQPIELARLADDRFCGAATGAWRIRIGDREMQFEVAP